MLRRTLGLLFRWSLVWCSFLGTLWLLVCLFQPVGTTKTLKSKIIDYDAAQRNVDRLIMSPSGRYVLTIYQGVSRDLGFVAQLFDVVQDEMVFEQTDFTNSQFAFADDDQLYFVIEKASDGFVAKQLQLMKLKSGEKKPEVVLSRTSCRPDLVNDDNPMLIHDKSNSEFSLSEFSDDQSYVSLFSKDAKRWLVFDQSENGIQLALYDTTTGQKLGSYALPGKNRTVDASFSKDSKVLLLHRASEDENLVAPGAIISWIDTGSGKVEHTLQLGVQTELGRILHIDTGNKVVAALTDNTSPRMPNGRSVNQLQILSMKGDYQSYLLKELLPDVTEHSWYSRPESIVDVSTELSSGVDLESNHLVQFWQYSQSSKMGIGKSSFLPGCHFAIRDLLTGNLIAHHSLPQRLREKYDVHPEGWYFRGVLPKDVLVLQTENLPYTPVDQWINRLRQQIRKWLKWDEPEEVNHLCFFDALSGVAQARLDLAQNIYCVHLNPAKDTLQLIGRGLGENKSFYYSQYPYPLRKPWFSMLEIATAVAATVCALQWSLIWLFRRVRKKTLPEECSQIGYLN